MNNIRRSLTKMKKAGGMVMTMGLALLAFSCNNDEPNDSPFVDPQHPSESTLLIYAVATNSLSPDLNSDKNEMLQAAQYIDLTKNNVLIFQTVYGKDEAGKTVSVPSLVKLIKGNSGYEWLTIREFSNETASLNPMRIREVVDYVFSHFSATTRGMMFWSHSSGSRPYLESRSETADAPLSYSFGSDLTTVDKKYREINVDELAEALPDNYFRYIWFDSCFMGNVESAYQLRNKCEYYVGYPTEVWSWGLNYDEVLPYLAKGNPDLVGAGQTFYNFYYNQPRYNNATIAVTDMSKIELLADFCRDIYQEDISVNSSGFIEYTKGTENFSYHFYDLGDYTKAMAAEQGMDLSDTEWRAVLDEVQLYRATSLRLFNNAQIDSERFSGLSSHIYNSSDNSEEEKYYRSLDWYKAVFE